MRRRIWIMAVAALTLSACAKSETGIEVSIDPDPIPASAVGSPANTYQASWTVTITELSGANGTLDTLDLQIRNATAVTELPIREPQVSIGAMAGFSRRFVRQAAQFRTTSGVPAVMVSARFTDQSGQTHTATAEARVELR